MKASMKKQPDPKPKLKPKQSSEKFKKDSAEFVRAGKTVNALDKMYPRKASGVESRMFKNISSSNPDRRKAGYKVMENVTKMNKILEKNDNRKSWVDSVTIKKKK
jgi:hypothetical protein